MRAEAGGAPAIQRACGRGGSARATGVVPNPACAPADGAAARIRSEAPARRAGCPPLARRGANSRSASLHRTRVMMAGAPRVPPDRHPPLRIVTRAAAEPPARTLDSCACLRYQRVWRARRGAPPLTRGLRGALTPMCAGTANRVVSAWEGSQVPARGNGGTYLRRPARAAAQVRLALSPRNGTTA